MTADSQTEASKRVVERFSAALNRGDVKAAADEFAAGALNYGEKVPGDGRAFFQAGIVDKRRLTSSNRAADVTSPPFQISRGKTTADGQASVPRCPCERELQLNEIAVSDRAILAGLTQFPRRLRSCAANR